MDVTQLRCFVAVAEEMHFGRAAQRLNMTQPPVSRQVLLLEQQLGLVLFDRSTRSVQLSQAGLSLLPRAREALATLEEVVAHARLLAGGDAGRVRIGFVSGVAYGILPALVAMISEGLPSIELTLLERPTAAQVAALEAGQLDLALVRPLSSRGSLATACVAREPLMLALPHDHRLAGLDRPVSANDLGDESFLSYSASENPYFHGLVTGAMQRAQLVPKRIRYARSIHTVMSLVRSGLGLALVPDVSEHLLVPGVILRPLAPPFAATVDTYLVWRPDNLNQAAQRILAEIVPKLGAGFAPESAADR